MPSWWLLVAFSPAVLVFLITMVAAAVSDAVTFHTDQVGALLLMAVVQSLLFSIFALGEEIGWRGFLWPLMRPPWKPKLLRQEMGASTHSRSRQGDRHWKSGRARTLSARHTGN